MKWPSVLIFTPIYDGKEYSLEKFLKTVDNFTYPNFRHILIDNSKELDFYNRLKESGREVYHVERGANTREAIARAENFGRRYAIDNGYDYILSLESDIYAPPDVIQRLMVHGQDVVTALYMIGNDEVSIPCITIPKWVEELNSYGTRLLTQEEGAKVPNSGLIEVHAGGFGCCLIHKRVFKEVVFTYDPRYMGHSDIYFFNDLFRKGIKTYVDTNVFCEHDHSDWKLVEDR